MTEAALQVEAADHSTEATSDQAPALRRDSPRKARNGNGEKSRKSPPRRLDQDIIQGMPAIVMEVTFQTERAQRIFARAFEALQRDLYLLTVKLDYLGYEEGAAAAAVLFDEAVKPVQEDLLREIERLDALMDQAAANSGMDVPMPDYGQSLTNVLRLTLPQSRRYIELVQLLDRLCQRADALYLAGAFTLNQSKQAKYISGQRVAKIGGRFRQEANLARKKIMGGEGAMERVPSDDADDEADTGTVAPINMIEDEHEDGSKGAEAEGEKLDD